MADNFKTGSDAETFKVESDVESSSGDSDYCPSNDGSYIESSPRPKPPRRSRKRTAKEAESRTLMRQWLLDLIDEGGIPELYWIDNDRTLVHIPWLHASRHTFDTAKDSTLFKLWAVHSGKYVPDEDTPDPKRWKANFRCAINSLSDVHEVKDQSCKKGHDAYKVYRFDADKRLAKKSSLSANERTMSNDVLPPSEKKVCKRPVLNADRRALMNAKKMNRMNQLSEPAIPTTRANEPAITMTRANEPAITMTRANEPAITMTRANEPAITMTRANEPAITMTRANEPAIPTTRANEPAIPTTRANEPAIAMPGAYVPFTATTLVLEPAIATTQTSTLATDIINWLKQQNCMQYGDMCNDTSSCKFSGMTAKNEVTPVVKYEGPGFYRSTAAVGRGDQGYAYAKNVTTGVTNSAAIPQMVEEYSSSTAIPQHTTYDSSLSPYSLDVCNSPTGTDSSIDSALTDDSIAEMIDEWQAEPKSETDGKWFMQLTSVNILCTPEDNYSFRDVPAQAGLRHPL